MKTLLLGIMAGLMISFGADAALIAGHAIDNMSVGRVVSGAIFPVGLISIVLTGSELLTGSCLNVLGISNWQDRFRRRRQESRLCCHRQCHRRCALGSHRLRHEPARSFQRARMGAYAIKTAVGKVGLVWASAHSGIWCNFLVCLAVFLAATAKDTVGKVAGIFFPIWVFVACGFEHSVANMFCHSVSLPRAIPDYAARCH